MKILKMCLQVLFSEITKKEAIYTLSMALTTHVNCEKEDKIYKNSPYCVSNAVEI
jgi:hypothetical protein